MTLTPEAREKLVAETRNLSTTAAAQLADDGETIARLTAERDRAIELAAKSQASAEAAIATQVRHSAERLEALNLNAQQASMISRLTTRAEAAEARVTVLETTAAQQRAEAMMRRHINAPEDPHVAELCQLYGYGAVMDAASRLWARKDSMGAFYIGGCIGMKSDDEARAALKGSKT